VRPRSEAWGLNSIWGIGNPKGSEDGTGNRIICWDEEGVNLNSEGDRRTEAESQYKDGSGIPTKRIRDRRCHAPGYLTFKRGGGDI